jgi:hypothetical protein
MVLLCGLIICCLISARGKSSAKQAPARLSRASSLGMLGVRDNGRWEEGFLVVQGFRLVWWAAEEDVDAGVVSEWPACFCVFTILHCIIECCAFVCWL